MRAPPLTALVMLLALLWSPLPLLLGGGEFVAHMIRHIGLVTLAAPLLAVGLPALPTPPVLIAALVEFAVVWGWHLPALHGLSNGCETIWGLEQAMFLLAGWGIWAGALRGHPLAGAGGLLITSMHMTLLGALLILAPMDLYAEIHGRAPDVAGQQLGGMVMLAVGTPVYLIGGLWLVRRALGASEGATGT